jgi:uncharacterized protein YggE
MATVTVLGRAVVRVPPDEAHLSLTVEATRASAGEALEDVSGGARRLVELCDELAISAERRVTTGASVSEHVEHDREGRRQHRGYRASNTLALRLADAELVGKVLQQAVESVSARVAGPWWSIAVDNPAHLEAARLAAVDARERAAAYAEALDARLGAITAVREPGTRRPPEPEPRAMYRMADASFEAAAPIEAGEQELTAAVEVEFALEQG